MFDLDKPIWVNGLPSPTESFSQTFPQIKARITGQVTSDRLFSMFAEFWGV